MMTREIFEAHMASLQKMAGQDASGGPSVRVEVRAGAAMAAAVAVAVGEDGRLSASTLGCMRSCTLPRARAGIASFIGFAEQCLEQKAAIQEAAGADAMKERAQKKIKSFTA